MLLQSIININNFNVITYTKLNNSQFLATLSLTSEVTVEVPEAHFGEFNMFSPAALFQLCGAAVHSSGKKTAECVSVRPCIFSRFISRILYYKISVL